MREPNPPILREFETWLSLLTDGELPDRHRWKAWFCVAEYELGDFERMSGLLGDLGTNGSFAFLGRDAEEQASIMEAMAADGHEIVFHSHRHHMFSDLSYDEAYEAITTGLAAIEDATGITPSGFFAPFLGLSEGAVRAVREVGFDWVLGRAAQDPADVTIMEPAIPFDVSLLEEHSAAETMARLREDAADGDGPFLFHPPVIEFYDGMDAFADWISDVEPVSVEDQLDGNGTGILLDCVRPVRVD